MHDFKHPCCLAALLSAHGLRSHNPAEPDTGVLQIFMGTFILAFVGNSFVHSARGSTSFLPLSAQWRRRCLVLAYFTMIVSIVSLFGVLTIPDIIREGADFVSRLQSENIWVVVIEKLRHGIGYAPLSAARATLRCLLWPACDTLVACIPRQAGSGSVCSAECCKLHDRRAAELEHKLRASNQLLCCIAAACKAAKVQLCLAGMELWTSWSGS